MPVLNRNKQLKEFESDILTLVEEPEYQLKIGENPDEVNIDEIEQIVNVWDKSVKVEENGYYWKGEPYITKGSLSKGNKPLVVELFCGCGGTSLGFEMAGFEIAIGCDIHQPSINTFKTNHPNVSTILGDVRKVTPEMILELLDGKQVDVLIGGVPCQGFSLNNRKRHENDERNLLYKEFVRFVNALKPKVVVLENVSGMKSTGDFVETIEKDLSTAGNMNVKSQLLYAPDYGVPQSRTRLVFVGIRGVEKFDFSEIKKTNGPETDKPFITVKEAIGDLPSLKSNETSVKYEKEPFCDYQRLMRKDLKEIKLTNHKAPNHPKEVIEKIKNTKPGTPMYPKFKQRIRLAWDIQSPTQVSGGIRPQFQFGHPSDDRGLTIRERCRIQSFPDEFVVSGGIVQGRVQTGNAVPPLLAKAIALAIKKYI
jgi:DNA (cytosine-5)-methyltransferase 1